MEPCPNGPYQVIAIELFDTQAFSGSVQWVLLEISWIFRATKFEIYLVQRFRFRN